jgi:formylglycine-generating enzyme required for sulfatase activity
MLAVLTVFFAPSVWAANSEPSAGTSWVEPKTGMVFVWVPGGCFQMGSSDGSANEQPVHQVCVQGFWMGKYEVTQEQYLQVTGDNPSRFQGRNHPVEQVNWRETQLFAEKMNISTGLKVMLPTEAQWEYACRAGNVHETYCGEGSRPERMAWFHDNSQDHTHPVGLLAPNKWGLHDMSGNVWEWVQDGYHSDYTDAPADGSAWEGHRRVLRGGSWHGVPQNLRVTRRNVDGDAERDSNHGFRLVRANIPL